jgi:hypothetical protein
MRGDEVNSLQNSEESTLRARPLACQSSRLRIVCPMHLLSNIEYSDMTIGTSKIDVVVPTFRESPKYSDSGRAVRCHEMFTCAAPDFSR